MNDAALIYNGVLWVLTAGGLVASLTVGRSRNWGRPAARWLAASCLVGLSVELVNLVVSGRHLHARWAPALFVLGAPFLVMSLVTDLRRRPAAGRP